MADGGHLGNEPEKVPSRFLMSVSFFLALIDTSMISNPQVSLMFQFFPGSRIPRASSMRLPYWPKVYQYVLQCPHDADVHLLFSVNLDLHSVPKIMLNINFLHRYSLIDIYHIAWIIQQKLCHFNKLSCIYCVVGRMGDTRKSPII